MTEEAKSLCHRIMDNVKDASKTAWLVVVGEDSCPFVIGLAAGATTALVIHKIRGRKGDKGTGGSKGDKPPSKGLDMAGKMSKAKAIILLGVVKVKNLTANFFVALRRMVNRLRGLQHDRYPNVTCNVISMTKKGPVRNKNVNLPEELAKEVEKLVGKPLEEEEGKAKARKGKGACFFLPDPKKKKQQKPEPERKNQVEEKEKEEKEIKKEDPDIKETDLEGNNYYCLPENEVKGKDVDKKDK